MKLNDKAYTILDSLAAKEQRYVFDSGVVRVLDVGIQQHLPIQSALKVAEASLGGLGEIKLDDLLNVRIPKLPAVATLGSQLAGWSITHSKGLALGSGPARLLANKPKEILSKIQYTESSSYGALLLESDSMPDTLTLEKILSETHTQDLIVAVFSGDSITGLINVLARVVEVAFFRLINLGYDVNRIKSAEGRVPFIKLSRESIFEANDAIIYKGSVSLEAECWDPELTPKVVSRNSPAYGKPFKKIFEEAARRFYQIPKEIFAPAELKVKDSVTGLTYSAP